MKMEMKTRMIELVGPNEPVLFRPANWNVIEDPLDKEIWDRLNKNFWLDTNFPISLDLASWNKMSDEEKWLVMRVFTGLTLLDTLQGHIGAPALVEDAKTDQEIAWLRNIAFMEEVHAKSYSTIFQTLASSNEIERAFRWSEQNEFLQNKARIIYRYYVGNDPLKKKAASTLLESFLFYSGFFLPLWLNGQAKLTNTADLIKLIIRDESVHGYAIGYKFQKGFEELPADEQEELKEWTYELLEELYDNEVKYTQDLYDEHDLTEEVKIFLRYNGNKALQNLGFEPLFKEEPVNPIVLSSMGETAETHDFFSATGNYAMAEKKTTTDEDWSDDWSEDDEW
jgi:ribonucleoside-diphosphate reductase beta chain